MKVLIRNYRIKHNNKKVKELTEKLQQMKIKKLSRYRLNRIKKEAMKSE
jgi:hypothetical protein